MQASDWTTNTKDFSLMLSPLSYKFIYANDTTEINQVLRDFDGYKGFKSDWKFLQGTIILQSNT